MIRLRDLLTESGLRVNSIRIIDGDNEWSKSKKQLVHMVLDLGRYEELPSNEIPGFYKALRTALPGMQSHRCSEGHAGGFFERVKRGTWLGHIIEHVALELQTLAGHDTGWGRTRSVKGETGVYNVVFNYEDASVGREAARAAVRLVKSLCAGRDVDVDAYVQRLKKIKS
jgi:cyanophycin synthetase